MGEKWQVETSRTQGRAKNVSEELGQDEQPEED